MRVSFTGTRHGMSEWQVEQLAIFLSRMSVTLFAHGACQGADVQACRVARKVFGKGLFIAAYPSTSKATCRIDEVKEICDFVAEPRPPLERDKTIVHAGRDLLIAAPLQDERVIRSGTWSTVRYAEKLKVSVKVLQRGKP